MGSINDNICAALRPRYGNLSSNHLLRLFEQEMGINLSQADKFAYYSANSGLTSGSINDHKNQLFANFDSIYGKAAGMYFTGITGNRVVVADAAHLDLTGDMCFIVHAKPDDWTPALFQTFISKFVATGNQRGPLFDLGTSGQLRFMWSTNGADFPAEQSTIIPPWSSHPELFLAVTLDVDNGDSVYEVRFWYSFDGYKWYFLESILGGATTSIYANTADLWVGDTDGGASNPYKGVIKYAAMYSGIGDNSAPGLGTLVAELDLQQPVDPRHRDSTAYNNIWTFVGSTYSWVEA